jgi:hypothetical protein
MRPRCAKLFIDCLVEVAIVQRHCTPLTAFTPGHHIPGQVGQRNSSRIPFRICSGRGALMMPLRWRLSVILIFVSLSGLSRHQSECFLFKVSNCHHILHDIHTFTYIYLAWMITLLQSSSSLPLFLSPLYSLAIHPRHPLSPLPLHPTPPHMLWTAHALDRH